MKNSLKFEVISLEWLDNIQASLKPSTYANYSFFLHNHIEPYFKGKIVIDITNKDINDFFKEKITNGRLDGKGALSPKTLKCLMGVLKLIFKYAEDMYDIPYTIKKVALPKQKKKKIEIFTQEEQSKIIEYAMLNPILANLSIVLALYTGMRVGEICALQWSNIDMKEGIINVINTAERVQKVGKHGNKGTKVVVHSAKSDCSMRKIPIPLSFKEKVLIKLYNEYALYNNEVYFVTGLNKVKEPHHLQLYLAKMLDECGIPRKNFHVLRHTFATNCVRMGFDIKTLSEILGHSDVSITLNTYVHSSMEVKQNYMNLLTI